MLENSENNGTEEIGLVTQFPPSRYFQIFQVFVMNKTNLEMSYLSMYGHVVTSHLSASHCYGSMSVDPPQHHLKTVNAKLCANFVDNTGLTYIDLLLTPMPGKLYPNFVIFVRTEVLASGIYRS